MWTSILPPTGTGRLCFVFCRSDWRIEREDSRFNPASLRIRWRELRARRKPRLFLVLPGVFLLRFAERQFCAVFLQLPPRLTRLEPDGCRPKVDHTLHESINS